MKGLKRERRQAAEERDEKKNAPAPKKAKAGAEEEE
jgi:hypothetical protein